VLVLVGDAVLVDDAITEDMDVEVGVGLIVRGGESLVDDEEELVDDEESLVNGGTLLDAAVVGTTLRNGSRRV